MYGRKMQRKIAHRKPISFKGFSVNGRDLETPSGGETQEQFARRLKDENGSLTRLTPRYAR